MFIGISTLLNPGSGLALGSIILIAFILGILHGATPDEHTWPITFSYAIGSFGTRKGMKAGFTFSAGFALQRALLTTLGFLGLAAIYQAYNLDGPVYVVVGVVMALSGAYILNKRRYLHLPFDTLFKSSHHSMKTERHKMHKIPTRMAFVHGLIAGFGFGAYATIITFVLAPQVPGLVYAPLVGLSFGAGTMVMQMIFGAVFSNLARIKKLTEKQMDLVGRRTAGRTLYYGGGIFAVIGALIILFPVIDGIALSTGNQIPNLDSIGVAAVLVIGVVGVVGIGSLILGFKEVLKAGGEKRRAPNAHPPPV